MSKFIVVKKNNIITYIVLVFTILLSICIIFFSKNSYVFSNTALNLHNKEEYDFDGDGTLDPLTILSTNSTYSLQVKTSKGDILLKSKEFDYSLLDVSPSCSIKIRYSNLTRNNIPEIIVTGLKNKIPTIYIFQWIEDDFKEVFFSQKNIFGILDYNNSRSPKILDTFSSKGNESTNGYILNNNKIKDITFSSPKIPSLGEIQVLIDLIEAEYEIEETPGIFTPYIPSEELGLLWNLDKGVYHYNFNNGYFYDASWNDFGCPTTIYWILSFEKVSYLNSNDDKKELLVFVKADLDEFGEYKISSLKKG